MVKDGDMRWRKACAQMMIEESVTENVQVRKRDKEWLQWKNHQQKIELARDKQILKKAEKGTG